MSDHSTLDRLHLQILVIILLLDLWKKESLNRDLWIIVLCLTE